MPEFLRAAVKSEVPNNQSKIVELKGKQVAIFNLEGKFYAIENVCAHRGGPVGEGDLEGKIVTCPWHGWQFDVTSGISTMNPSAKVKSFECKTEGDDIFVLMD